MVLPVVELIAMPPEQLEALACGDVGAVAAGAPNFAAVAALVSEVAQAYAVLYARDRPEAPWIGYLARDAATGEIVGSCGFNGGLKDGVSEIAYFTFPDFERRGYGRAMARAVLAVASNAAGLTALIAHTLPVANPSTRILKSVGFEVVGDAEDPDEGRVWRWQLSAGQLLRDNKKRPPG